MKNKHLAILISVLLIVLIASSSALYNMLSDRMEPDNLLIQHNTATPGLSDTDSSSDNTESSDEDNTNNSSETSDNNSNTSDENTPFTAPDFTVYDRNGTAVHLSDFLGKPVVLNFWASWCGPCKMEMPAFEEMYKEYGENVQFIMVNLTDGARETEEIATTFLDANGYTFPVYFDKDTDAALTYQVYGIPVTYFINAKGHLIAQGSSALNAETIKRGIEMILE
ncbi:MAG: redoxin domain-containing protein [Lachnospiraceae bacterium]|nr:redoxin domain-containing protein [Lachnospiraceae bacterium]